MDALMNWLAELNRNHHLWFAILTVAVMSGLGMAIGMSIELIFGMLGIKYDKIEIEH